MAQALDFEILSTYRLTIVASDEGTPAMSSTMVQEIKITNTNDLPVACSDSYLYINIAENISVNTEVMYSQLNSISTRIILKIFTWQIMSCRIFCMAFISFSSYFSLFRAIYNFWIEKSAIKQRKTFFAFENIMSLQGRSCLSTDLFIIYKLT